MRAFFAAGSSPVRHVVVLCGGMGRRMGELTATNQKCLLPWLGQPLLEHVLERVQAAFDSVEVILATGYHGQKVYDHFGPTYRGLRLRYVDGPEGIETKARLLGCREHIIGRFLLMAGDVLYDPALLTRLAATKHRAPFATGVIAAATDHRPAQTHGIVTIEGSQLRAIEHPPGDRWEASQFRDMTVGCYEPSFLDGLSSLPATTRTVSASINRLLHLGESFHCVVYREPWYHFAAPQDLDVLPKNLQLATEAPLYDDQRMPRGLPDPSPTGV
jgi:NDP-sugar pyrophosphorylase family protein